MEELYEKDTMIILSTNLITFMFPYLFLNEGKITFATNVFASPDLKNDGIVDIHDIVYVASNYGLKSDGSIPSLTDTEIVTFADSNLAEAVRIGLGMEVDITKSDMLN